MRLALIRLALAVVVSAAGGLALTGVQTVNAADADPKLCGTAICGNGELCILCGQAQHQFCERHADCQ